MTPNSYIPTEHLSDYEQANDDSELLDSDRRFQYGHLFNVDFDINNVGQW
mgnify:CR=1 FL=1